MTHFLVGLSIILANASQPQRVAFCLKVYKETHLYVINLDGTGFNGVTTSQTEDLYPAWSPNGSTIYFTRLSSHKVGDGDPNGHLWSVRPDGTRLTQLTAGSAFDSIMGWSDKGKRLSFRRSGPSYGIYELDVTNKKVSRPELQLWKTSISPNGKWIAHIRSESGIEDDQFSDLWLTSSVQKLGQRLTNFKTMVYYPQWSPDGTKIAFVRELPPGPNSGDALCIMTISTRKVRTIAKGRGNRIAFPRWSPNGKSLCFTESQREEEQMTNDSYDRLYVISADGSTRRRLTNQCGDDVLPEWTRDGRFIVIQGDRGMTRTTEGTIGVRSTSLIVVSASGRGERILCTGVYNFSFALSP